MAVFKCKICGGSLEIDSAQSVATCEYCGTKQTLPKVDDERRANLYDRANHFRRNNDFDKAMGIYENILNEDNTDAEAHWSIVLCRYGIEYVEDPSTHKHVPTVNRAQFTSIFDDEDYKSAIENADTYQRAIYETEATTINEIQKGILAISQKEEPFDVFVCYKETDAHGRRTQDSVLATELYHELTRDGFKVFFSRITLEDKLGVAYEPYIFAALHSAKVMVVLGTRPEYFNAVWVKNEWSRFLSLIKSGAKKVLIPAYRDMDPYDLPEEFSHLQAQDMSKLGFMQDLTRGIQKIIGATAPKAAVKETIVTTTAAVNIAPLLKRVFMFLEDGDWGSADEYCEKVLDQDPENAQAYLGKLMVELRVRKKEQLANCRRPFDTSDHYRKIIRFADEPLRTELQRIVTGISERNKAEQLASQYESIMFAMHQATTEDDYRTAAKRFAEMGTYKEADRLSRECLEKAEEVRTAVLERVETARKNNIYTNACQLKTKNTIPDLERAIVRFKEIPGWKDSQEQIYACERRIAEIKTAQEQRRLEKERQAEFVRRESERKKRERKQRWTIAGILIIGAIVCYIAVNAFIIPTINFNDAVALMENSRYDEARDILVALDGFGSSEDKITIIDAIADIKKGNFDPAIKNILSTSTTIDIQYNYTGGNSSEGENVTYSTPEEYSSLVLPVKEGYRFVEWKLFGYSYRSEGSLRLCLDALWSDGYSITYDLDGGNARNPVEYHKDGEAITLNNPTRQGYTFIGWTGTGLDDLTMSVTIPSGSHGDREYTANWEAHGKITYNLDGGTATNVNEYTFLDDDFTLNNPTRKGYTFIGWTGTGLDGLTMTVTIPSGSHGDREYTANWEANKYTITLDANGGVVDKTSISTKFDEAYVLPVPTRDYYTFAGWYAETQKYENGKWSEVSDVTLTAKWKPVFYTITYNLVYGTNSSQNVQRFTVESSSISLKDPTRTGYKFLGWYKDSSYSNRVTEIAAGSHENITLYAKWEIITYTITYNLNEGLISGSLKTTFTIKDLPLSLPSPTKTDYVFLGWKKNDYNGADIAQITDCANVTLYASYMDVYLQLQLYKPSYSYQGTETYYVVKKYSGNATSVDIPAYYEGYPIREIASGAFEKNAVVTTVNIPYTVTAIGSYAFSGCSSLKQIILPEGIETIAASTFSNCTVLTSVAIPNTVTAIYSNAFAKCTSLETIQLPNALTDIGYSAFQGCTSLKSINIPGTVAEIEYCTFSQCNNLENVVLNEGLKRISFGAFSSPKLTKLIIPKSVTYIDADSFDYSSYGECSNIVFFCRSAVMPSGWETGWNIGRPVIWGYDESTHKDPTYTFVTNGGSPIASMTQTLIPVAPVSTKSGYVLTGWYDNPSFFGEAIDFPYYNITKTTLYAKWMLASEYYNGTSFERAYNITLGRDIKVNLVTIGQQIYYRFVPTESRSYTITSSQKPYIYCYLYDSLHKQLKYDYAASYDCVSITYNLEAGKEYYIMIKHWSSAGTGSCTFEIN